MSPKEARQALVTALRSGEYSQTREALRKGNSYCCLGVACDIYRKITGYGHWGHGIPIGAPTNVLDANRPFVVLGYSRRSILPPPVRDFFGFREWAGEWSYDHNLSGANDDGASFHEIADIIEAEPGDMILEEHR